MLNCFRSNEHQAKIPNERSAGRFPREENIDLFFYSDVVGPLLKTNGGREGETEGTILLEGSFSVI